MKEFFNRNFGLVLIAIAIAYAGTEIAHSMNSVDDTLKCFENYSGSLLQRILCNAD